MKRTTFIWAALLVLLPVEAAAIEPVRQGQEEALVRGVYAEARLWLLSDAGQLFSVRPGDTTDRQEFVPGNAPIFDICQSPSGFVALSAKGNTPAEWIVWARGNGQWSQQMTLPAKGEVPLALMCGIDGETVLTATRLIAVSGQKIKATQLSEKVGYGVASTLMTSNAVYVGFNRGEWGGGLNRIDRVAGKVSVISDAPPHGCGGLLNASCDPVNGLVVAPGQPDCIAAAVGLVHIVTNGRIVKVCGGRIKLLYRRQIGQRYPNISLSDDDAYPTMAFFGLAASGDHLLAVGLDGLYLIGADGKAMSSPLPVLKKVGPFRISFERRDVAIVLTTENERDSVSGAVPMMVATPGR